MHLGAIKRIDLSFNLLPAKIKPALRMH